MDRDWGNLEALVLCLILDKLAERIDHIWFGAVCKNWHSIAKFKHQNQQFRSNALPMLMIPMEIVENKNSGALAFSLYGMASNRFYQFPMPVPYHGRCCGSSHGWLVTVDDDYVITLLNPFKVVDPIHLPPIVFSHRDSCEYNIHKVILSADPIRSPNDYAAVAIISRRNSQSSGLMFTKVGRKFWTYVYHYCCFSDVISYKGLIYAVSVCNGIFSFLFCYWKDISDSIQIIPKVVSLRITDENNYLERAYLVKSLEGDLWLVRRFIDHKFEVYKLELDVQDGKPLNMLKLESLGDNVLFLGYNESISVSASYFSNCLQNDSIYFTGVYYFSGPFDIGIYNIKDGSLSQQYPPNPLFRWLPPSLWVLPPFKWD